MRTRCIVYFLDCWLVMYFVRRSCSSHLAVNLCLELETLLSLWCPLVTLDPVHSWHLVCDNLRGCASDFEESVVELGV